MDWQPIETAPKDGTEIFALSGRFAFRSRYMGYWVIPDWVEEYESPTHWMPIEDITKPIEHLIKEKQ